MIRAGLLPVLAEEPGWWTLPPILPGTDPVAALVRQLAATAQQLGCEWTVEKVRHQLEELLTQTSREQRSRFARDCCIGLSRGKRDR